MCVRERWQVVRRRGEEEGGIGDAAGNEEKKSRNRFSLGRKKSLGLL